MAGGFHVYSVEEVMSLRRLIKKRLAAAREKHDEHAIKQLEEALQLLDELDAMDREALFNE